METTVMSSLLLRVYVAPAIKITTFILP